MMYFASCKDQGMSIDEIEDHSIIEDFKFQKEMWRQSGNKWLNLISVLKIIFYLDYIAFFNYITIWLFWKMPYHMSPYPYPCIGAP